MRHRHSIVVLGLAAVVGLAAVALRPVPEARVAKPAAPPAPTAKLAAPPVAAAIITAPVAAASTAKAAPRHARVTRPALAPAQAGMVVAVDPETGQLGMASAEQRAALGIDDDLLSRSTDGLVVEHHAHGAVSIDLQGRFQEYTVVRMGPDGKPVFSCVHDAAGLHGALDPHAPAAPILEDK